MPLGETIPRGMLFVKVSCAKDRSSFHNKNICPYLTNANQPTSVQVGLVGIQP